MQGSRIHQHSELVQTVSTVWTAIFSPGKSMILKGSVYFFIYFFGQVVVSVLKLVEML